MPLFSVVIPLYNKEVYIKRAINSILCQTIQSFEIIVVNDGSTDKSAEIVKHFTDPRIQLINQENLGVSVARNRGINESKGDLVAFLDADDEWKPNFLEEVLELSRKHPDAGAYATAYSIYLPDGKTRIAEYKAIPPAPWKGLLPSYFLAAAIGEHPICSSSVCIPKQIFSDVGNFKFGSWWGEDDDMWGRIAVKYPIAFSWDIGCINHREAMNRTCNRLEIIEEHPFVKTVQILTAEGKIPTNISNDVKECIANYKIISAVHNIHLGKPKLARAILLDCETKLLHHQRIFWLFNTMIPSSYFPIVLKIETKVLGLFKKIDIF